MRLNVHDYSGHPFQVQLSRELAARGHTVLHTYAEQYVTGRGRLQVAEDDPPTLRIRGLRAPHNLVKYAPVRRLRFERAYARSWQQLLDQEPFDLVVACNVPLFALAEMRRYFASRRQPWMLWHQDLYSLAIGAEASRQLPPRLATAAKRRAERLERDQVAAASSVIAITDAMLDRYREWGIDTRHVDVIPNWAPINDIVPVERNNAWARELGLPRSDFRLLYAGTLGRKHNPRLLLDVLDGMRARGVPASLVVASEGDGADCLAHAAGDRPDVRIVGFQPADRFSEVLSSADATVALLEPDASRFSVPSKVLSYLSAGRPIVALLPSDNQAAGDVEDAGGFVAMPDARGADAAASWLARAARAPGALETIGGRARVLAEKRFDIGRIADEFEQAFHRAITGVSVARPPVAVAMQPWRASA